MRACARAVQFFENSGISFDEVWIEDPRELELRSGRVQQGADDVENAGAAALGDKFPHRHNRAECGMAGRSKKEAAAGGFQGRGAGLRQGRKLAK